MLQLLETFSISQIVVFAVLFCVAIREVVSFFEWVYTTFKKFFAKEAQRQETDKDLQEQITEMNSTFAKKEEKFNKKKKEINDAFDKLGTRLDGIEQSITLLLSSDRDDIKAYITEKYHYFTEQGWIDTYSLDCIERRYAHYVKEGGNSFIRDLMERLRKMPTKPPKK